jgi:hypothetical protein
MDKTYILGASPPPWPYIFSEDSFLVHHTVNQITGNSLHVQWPLTSQSHGRGPKPDFIYINFVIISLYGDEIPTLKTKIIVHI